MERWVTNTANSGTGSLRAAVEGANDADVVRFDPFIFADGGTIVLASPLRVNASIQIISEGKRIIIYSAAAAASINDVLAVFDDLIICGTVSATGGTATFRRCVLAGNEAAGNGLYATGGANVVVEDSVLTGQRGRPLYLGTSVNATFRRCTIAGNIQAPYKVGSATLSEVDGINTTVPSSIGFRIPPPDDLTGYAGALPWNAWDLRLKESSSYTTGGTGGTYDRDGTPRKANGAIGAYEFHGVDAFWIGVDQNGAPVEQPRWNNPAGWATSPTLTASDVTTIPASACILGTVEFLDAPTVERVVLGSGGKVTLEDVTPERGGVIASLEAGVFSSITNRGDQITRLELYDAAKYNGDWNDVGTVVVNGNVTVSFNSGQIRTLELEDGATIVIESGGLVGVENATLGQAVIMTTTGRAYFGVSPDADADAVTFSDVVRVPRGAGVISFDAVAAAGGVVFNIAKTNDEVPVLVEKATADGWIVVDDSAPVPTDAGRTVFRVCDGEKFIEDAATVPGTYWTVEPWAVNVAGPIDGDGIAWKVDAWALKPEIEHLS